MLQLVVKGSPPPNLFAKSLRLLSTNCGVRKRQLGREKGESRRCVPNWTGHAREPHFEGIPYGVFTVRSALNHILKVIVTTMTLTGMRRSFEGPVVFHISRLWIVVLDVFLVGLDGSVHRDKIIGLDNG